MILMGYGLFLAIMKASLAAIRVQYRSWLLAALGTVFIVLLVLSVLLSVLRMKKGIKKNISVLITLLISLFTVITIILSIKFVYCPDKVTEINGQKYVVVTRGIKNPTPCYYEYENIFLMGDEVRIEIEDIDTDLRNLSSDELSAPENHYNNVTFYDMDGNTVSSDEFGC